MRPNFSEKNANHLKLLRMSFRFNFNTCLLRHILPFDQVHQKNTKNKSLKLR